MTATIMVVDDEEFARTNICEYLSGRGFETIPVSTLKETRERLNRGEGDVILLDVELPDGLGSSLLEETSHEYNRPPIIIITGHAEIEMAVAAMRNGAFHFLQKPVKFPQLDMEIQKALENVKLRQELDFLRQSRQDDLKLVAGKNPAFRNLLKLAQRAAEAQVSVLITGETGTGKEIIAKAIHSLGPRSKKPFIDINSSTVQSTIVESELFGYEAGAFTGAEKRKPGLMEVADGGVLFLDEISTMPPDMQAKLLRALQERAFRRVGGTNLIKVDVQVVAASNKNLPALIAEGKFRDDLYYRLKVVDLHVPPLRERKEDIPELVGFFIHHFNQDKGLNVINVTSRAMEALKRYNWPGNIRELRNVIERAMIFCDGEKIDLGDLSMDVSGGSPC